MYYYTDDGYYNVYYYTDGVYYNVYYYTDEPVFSLQIYLFLRYMNIPERLIQISTTEVR